jgi:hypothetical protein
MRSTFLIPSSHRRHFVMMLLHNHLTGRNLRNSSKAGTAIVSLPLKSLFIGSRKNSNNSRHITYFLYCSLHLYLMLRCFACTGASYNETMVTLKNLL